MWKGVSVDDTLHVEFESHFCIDKKVKTGILGFSVNLKNNQYIYPTK